MDFNDRDFLFLLAPKYTSFTLLRNMLIGYVSRLHSSASIGKFSDGKGGSANKALLLYTLLDPVKTSASLP